MLKLSKKMKLFLFLISYIFACTLVLSDKIMINGEFIESFATEFSFDLGFWGLSFLVSIPILISLTLVINCIVNLKFKKSKIVWNDKKIFWISLIGIFLSSLLFLLTYYPGSNMNDTLYILHNPVYYSFQYPLIYNLIVSGIYKLFLLITSSMNFAFFMVGLIQIIFMSIIISYVILWFHREFKRNYFTILLMIYFIFLPIINNYNGALLRDPIYAALLMLMIPFLYTIIKSKGKYLKDDKNIIKLIILFTCLSFSRNNGIFVIGLLLLVMLFMYRKFTKKIIMIAFGFLVLAITPEVIVSDYEVEQLFQEKVAIPMQQIVYTMKYDKLNGKNDEKFMNNLVRKGVIIDYYCPFNMDCIKWGGAFKNFEFNDMKREFFSIWISNLPTHFISYVKAYLLQTYHLWAIESISDQQSTFFGLDNRDKQVYYYFNKLEDYNVFPNKIQRLLEKYYEYFTTYFNAGTCFWIMIFICVIFIIKRQNKYILLSLGSLFSWITLMIACPLAEAFRYVVFFAYILPILLFIALLVPMKDKVS